LNGGAGESKILPQRDNPTHLWGKRKQRFLAPNVPLGRRGIKASTLLCTIHSIHGFKSAKAAELEPEHPNFLLPFSSELGF